MNDISAFLEFLISFAPMTIMGIVVLLLFSKDKKLPQGGKDAPKLPQNTTISTKNGNMSIEEILKEVRNQIANPNPTKQITTQPEKPTQEKPSYEIQTYENQSYEIQNPEKYSRESQSYEVLIDENQSYEQQSQEILSYEEDYKNENKSKKVKIKEINTTPHKKFIARKQRNIVFDNKADMRKAFLMAELLKPKF